MAAWTTISRKGLLPLSVAVPTPEPGEAATQRSQAAQLLEEQVQPGVEDVLGVSFSGLGRSLPSADSTWVGTATSLPTRAEAGAATNNKYSNS